MSKKRISDQENAKKSPSRAVKNTPKARARQVDPEWTMPAGFTADGSRMATLKEVLNPVLPTRSMLQLSADHQFDLAAKRVEMRADDFSLTIPLYGKIGKARAVSEIRARTPIGKHLAEIEQMIVSQSMARFKKAQRGDR